MTAPAYQKGYRAAYAGVKDNPYPKSSKNYHHWNRGYEEARCDILAGR